MLLIGVLGFLYLFLWRPLLPVLERKAADYRTPSRSELAELERLEKR